VVQDVVVDFNSSPISWALPHWNRRSWWQVKVAQQVDAGDDAGYYVGIMWAMIT